MGRILYPFTGNDSEIFYGGYHRGQDALEILDGSVVNCKTVYGPGSDKFG